MIQKIYETNPFIEHYKENKRNKNFIEIITKLQTLKEELIKDDTSSLLTIEYFLRFKSIFNNYRLSVFIQIINGNNNLKYSSIEYNVSKMVYSIRPTLSEIDGVLLRDYLILSEMTLKEIISKYIMEDIEVISNAHYLIKLEDSNMYKPARIQDLIDIIDNIFNYIIEKNISKKLIETYHLVTGSHSKILINKITSKCNEVNIDKLEEILKILEN